MGYLSEVKAHQNDDKGYRIHGYIDSGKFVVNLAYHKGPHLLVSSFIQ